MNNIVVQEIQMKILAMLLQQMMIGIHKMLTKEWVRMVKFWKLENSRENPYCKYSMVKMRIQVMLLQQMGRDNHKMLIKELNYISVKDGGRVM